MPTTGEDETAPVQADPERQAAEDSYCWVCGAAVIDRHCKIVCPRCGFTRDCSDP